jgi:hypothetical protein
MATIDDKLSRIVSRMQDRTGLYNLVPGSKAYQIAQSCAYEQMQLENQLDLYSKRNSIISSQGKDLNYIGENFFGTKRRKSVTPFITEDMKTLKFYVKYGKFGDINTIGSTPNNIVIPEGTIISGGSGTNTFRFRLKAQVTLLTTAAECFIGAELLSGPNEIIQANTLTSHNFTEYVGAASNSLLVTNVSVIGTGRSDETDENYRYRISNSLKAFPKTNYFGLYDMLTSIPGISEVYIDHASNGGGTCTFYVQGISPITSDATISAAQTVLDSVIPPWVNYTVTKPNYIGLEIVAAVKTRQTYDVQQSTTITTLLTDRLSTYINNYFGTEFYIQDIAKYITSASYDIVSCDLTLVNGYVGPMDFRGKVPYSVTTIDEKIYLSKNEKLIIEPKESSVIITVTQ